MPPLLLTGQGGPTWRGAIGPASRAAGKRVGILIAGWWTMAWPGVDAARYGAIVRREADFVGGAETDWSINEPTEGNYAFAGAGPAHALARSIGQGVMPYLVIDFPHAVPSYIAGLTPTQVEARLRAWIAEYFSRDPTPPIVIIGNECTTEVDDPGGYVQGPGTVLLRNNVLAQKLGFDFIRIAFHEASLHAAAGTYLITGHYFINGGLSALSASRQGQMLDIVDDLIGQGIRIDGIADESHLRVDWPNEWLLTGAEMDAQTAFLGELQSRGKTFHLTELDHIDHASLPADIAARDALMAERVGIWLDTCLAHPVTRTVHVWGTADHLSWANAPGLARTDALPARSLPWDSDWTRKPMYWTILDNIATHWGG